MARKLRVEYPGAMYHLMNRGDRKEPIFRDDDDRHCFLATLGEACEKTNWQVHALCLMDNHFHLVVETPRGELVAGMKWFLGTYTCRFNRRHRLCGHVFAGRYKSLIVDGSGDGYLKAVCDYVHLNPVRAGLVDPEVALSAYQWSSWPQYLKLPSRRWPWLRVDRLLGEYRIPRDSVAGRRRLERELEARRLGEASEDHRSVRRGWCLGEAEFRRELLGQMAQALGKHHAGPERREAATAVAERIVAEELGRLGWSEDDLGCRAKGDPGKAVVARRLRRESTVTLAWIAQRLRMGSASTVTHCLRGKRCGDC